MDKKREREGPQEAAKDRLIELSERRIKAIKAVKVDDVVVLVKLVDDDQMADVLEELGVVFAATELLRAKALAKEEERLEKSREAFETVCANMLSSAKENYELLKLHACNPYAGQASPNVGAMLVAIDDATIEATEVDANVKLHYGTIDNNMKIAKADSAQLKAYHAALYNRSMIQLAQLFQRYRGIHKGKSDDALHKSFHKLVTEESGKAKSASYLKGKVTGALSFSELANTFHALRYASLTVTIWRDNYVALTAELENLDDGDEKRAEFLTPNDASTPADEDRLAEFMQTVQAAKAAQAAQRRQRLG